MIKFVLTWKSFRLKTTLQLTVLRCSGTIITGQSVGRTPFTLYIYHWSLWTRHGGERCFKARRRGRQSSAKASNKANRTKATCSFSSTSWRRSPKTKAKTHSKIQNNTGPLHSDKKKNPSFQLGVLKGVQFPWYSKQTFPGTRNTRNRVCQLTLLAILFIFIVILLALDHQGSQCGHLEVSSANFKKVFNLMRRWVGWFCFSPDIPDSKS